MAAKRKAAENAATAIAEQASQRKRTKSADSSKSDGTKEKSVKTQVDSSRDEAQKTLHDKADIDDSQIGRPEIEKLDLEEGIATTTDSAGMSQITEAVPSRSAATRSSSGKPMKDVSADAASQQHHHRDKLASLPALSKPLRHASKPKSKARRVVAETSPDVSDENAKPKASELTNKRPASARNKHAKEASPDASSNLPAKGREPSSGKKTLSLSSSKVGKKQTAAQKDSPAEMTAIDEAKTSSDSDPQVDISGEFAITVLHSARPQVKQVYSTISFQGLPDSKIHSTIVRPFCFGHDPRIQKTTENTDEQPSPEDEGEVTIIRPLKKSFLKVNRLTFFAVTGFQPSNHNKETVLRAGPQQKINSFTGLPMVDPQSRDFVRDFDRAFYSDKGATEHPQRQREALTSELQTSDDVDEDDGAEVPEDSSEMW